MQRSLVWKFYTEHFPFSSVSDMYAALGHIPEFLDPEDPRPAVEQLDDKYAHFGGWCPMRGYSMIDGVSLKYSGDPLMHPIASTTINGETVFIYQGAWVCVKHDNATFEVARLD